MPLPELEASNNVVGCFAVIEAIAFLVVYGKDCVCTVCTADANLEGARTIMFQWPARSY